MFLQRLSEHRWLRAVRNSLVLLLPVVFVGAIALLLGSFPYSAVLPKTALTLGNEWREMAILAWNASSGIMALCLVVLISHFLAVETRDRQIVEISPPLVAIVSLVNFFILARFSNLATGAWELGPRNVLPAILVAILSTELFLFFTRFKVLGFGQKTYDLDPVLHLALNAIGPVVTTVTVFVLASQGFSLLSFDLSLWVRDGAISFNDAFGSQLPGLLVLGLLNQMLWFVGIHGWNVLESIYPVLFATPGNAKQVFDITTTFFNLYVHIGGAGSTLGLLLAIQIYAQQGEARRVAKYALIPSLFNINELVIFGLPIIFNPIYLLPFLIAPLMQAVVSFFCIRYGLVVLDVTVVPWMTPPILAGTLNAGSWHGGALQLFNIVMSAMIYAPFVRIAERQRNTENFSNVRRIVAEIGSIKLQHGNVLDRHDDIGHTSRKLLHEFLRDIDADSDRVYLAYQPQHDRKGRVIGVEALLRWEHLHFGFISPAVICALLEEAHQIIPFGRWTITMACQQLHRWKSAGIQDLRMSINLSPLQLRDATLLAFVDERLKTNQLLAWEVGLELTESQHVPDDPLSIKTLKGLESLGIYLEMDDFGMGFSSMLYLRRFRFNAIKLDGVLTKEVLQDKNCRDIITSVVQLGEASGIRVVAEYVETRDQQALLEQLGCDEFQGYLYSPALAEAECLEYLQNRAAGGVMNTSEFSDCPCPDPVMDLRILTL